MLSRIAAPKPLEKAAERAGDDSTAIGKTAMSLSMIAVVAKVCGFAEKLIVAHFFGTDARADVYFASMGMVLSMVFLIKELIYPSALPVFAQTLKISFCASGDLFRRIFFRLLLTLGGIAVIALFFSESITGLLVPGFSDEKKMLTSSLLRWLAPAGIFMGLMTFTQSILNCRRNFLKAAIPDAGSKLLIAVGLIILIPVMDMYALAVVASIGACLAFIVQFMFIPESKAIWVHNEYQTQDKWSRILRLMGPLAIGAGLSHISGLVDNMLASTLPTGQLSSLAYAKKLIDALVLIGPVALVTVVYSQLSHLSAERRPDQFKSLFVGALRLILFVSIPGTIALVMLRYPMVTALFGRGRFTVQSALGTSQALFIYAAGLVTFSVEALVVYSFYALSNTRIPVRAGIFGVLLDILLAVLLVGPLGFAAIAGAYVFSKTVKVVILLFLMDRKFPFLQNGEFLKFLFRVGISCMVSALSLYLLRGRNPGGSFLEMLVLGLAVPGMGFAGAFVVCCRLLKIEELSYFWSLLLRRKRLPYQLAGDMP